MSTLPYEVWVHIISYLPDGPLEKLMGVSAVFLHAALDRRYRAVDIARLSRTGVAKLERLRDPFIAKRVRTLAIVTGSLDLLKTWQSFEHSRRSSWRKRLLSLKTSAKKLILPKDSEHNVALRKLARTRPTKKTTAEMIQLLMSIIPKMTNIQYLSVSWFGFREDPTAREPAYLQVAWPAVGENLRQLRIHMDPCRLPTIASHLPNLRKLEDIHVTVLHSEMIPVKEPQVIWKMLASLYNKFADSLQVLSFAIFSNLDMSDFFTELGYFPHLRELRIEMVLDEKHLSDPSGLRRLLKDHSATLERLDLGTDPHFYCAAGWPQRIMPQTHFPKLKALLLVLDDDIEEYATPRTEIPLQVQQLFPGLDSMVLTGRYLEPEEVLSWVEAFTNITSNSSLRKLELQIKLLSKEVLDVLANAFPTLESLCLHCQWAGTPESPEVHQPVSDHQFVRPFMFAHLSCPRPDRITSWRR
ncbi:hypothetical protein HGRIS_013620 [Hohenbuehelia grisea]|uniref:F-box domain-containing protein n=1 Tax=Hohenbuehelia grisea TaxID=104357 RepID=A0ABR3IW89_9AGAR